MRVIAGVQKGRPLIGPPNHGLRPTPNRVREALFSILGPRIAGARIADLYAGTGAVGIEALSRGAGHVAFVESDPQALRLVRANLVQCGLAHLAAVYATSVADFLRRKAPTGIPYDIIFADPPYRHDAGKELLPALASGPILAPDALVVLEHFSKAALPTQVGQLCRRRQYRYGDTTLSVFGVSTEGTSAL